MNTQDLFDCVFSAWSPQIGDPTLIGWATVVAYALATVLALSVVATNSRRGRFFWVVVTGLLCLLAINKQLDLQSALTAAARCLAQAQGWYEDRRSVQVAFIFFVAAAALVLGLTLAWTMRRQLPQIWLALLGLCLLLGFVAIRAAGFHHMDRLIGFEIGGVRMNWLLELGGIALIAINALVLISRRRNPVD
ncbi:isopropylmalate isomerase [Cognatiyoonia sp. IB215182]|uniref:isopropylmalate isomerase n=1 Tax=Cognatiyoonia sp. IB215182 TaxID=3097353 RepID=UPI002A16B0F5|nr:isopropylmalate isomerase [Cognatiyoonia sp. IB215182]MDX8353118.1 isopropylmalate isomerase [Cognatiyoonia sp. IB215182]